MEDKGLNKKLMECVSSPVAFRLLIEIAKQKQVTAKYLCEKCADIPQTTLYRKLKRMTADGLLEIVSETPIRGTVERTYSLAFDFADPDAVLSQNSGPLYMQMFIQYLMVFAKQFQAYCDTPGINIKEDMAGFSLSHVYLTDDELKQAAEAISKIFTPFEDRKPAKDKKLRMIGFIVSPEEK